MRDSDQIRRLERELRERGGAPVPAPSPAPRGVSALLFELGPRAFAVEGIAVREVIVRPPVCALPGAPAHILGVALVRGEVVALLDLVTLLEPESSPEERAWSRVLIVERGALVAGLIASRTRLEAWARPASAWSVSGADARLGLDRDGSPDAGRLLLDVERVLREAAPAGAREPL